MQELETGVAATGSAALAQSPGAALERRGGKERPESGGGVSCRCPGLLSGVPGPCSGTGAAGMMEGSCKGKFKRPQREAAEGAVSHLLTFIFHPAFLCLGPEELQLVIAIRKQLGMA